MMNPYCWALPGSRRALRCRRCLVSCQRRETGCHGRSHQRAVVCASGRAFPAGDRCGNRHPITDALRGEAQLNNSQQWLALNIEAGLPVIDSANSAQFIPQATNLQALGGISFKKGCYPARRWLPALNSAAPTSAPCGIWREQPAACLRPGRPGAEDG